MKEYWPSRETDNLMDERWKELLKKQGYNELSRGLLSKLGFLNLSVDKLANDLGPR
jgi:hypothetical protein